MTTFRRKFFDLNNLKLSACLELWTLDNDNASRVNVKLCTFDLQNLRSKIQLSNDMHPLLSSGSQIKL